MSVKRPPAITTDQMREVDRLMIEEYSISLEEMMENAGRNLADLAMEMLSRSSRKGAGYSVAVACGLGNNGGGGMVAARFLSNRAVKVTVVLAGREGRLRPVPAQRWHTLNKLPVNMIVAREDEPIGIFAETDLIIDAIIGYGLRGRPKGIPAHVIGQIVNSRNSNILSLDVPSGLDSTDGSAQGRCVRAKATMTLALPKTGLTSATAGDCVGELFVADIGVPPELYRKIGLPAQYLFTEETILDLGVTP